jgi:hypothetical protein
MMHDYVEFEKVIVKKVTSAACLLEINYNRFWVPFSTIDLDESDKIEKDNICTIFIEKWLVEKEGIE